GGWARMGGGTVVRGLVRAEDVAGREHARRTEEDLKEVVPRFHGGQKLDRRNGLSSAVTEVGSMIVSAHGSCRLGVVERCGTSRTPHLLTRATARRHHYGAAHSPTV